MIDSSPTQNPWLTADPYTAMIDATANLVNTGFNAWATIKNNQLATEQNKLQREAFEWNKAQGLLQMQREDNAIYRRKLDLIRSGFNPVLATGSAASSSANAQVQGPQFAKMDKMEKMSSMLAIAQAMQQNVQLRAQTELAREQAKGVQLENAIKPVVLAKEMVNVENARKEGAYRDLNIVSKALENEYNAWENNRTFNTGISKDSPAPMKYLRDVGVMAQHQADLLGAGVRSVSSQVESGISNFTDSVSRAGAGIYKKGREVVQSGKRGFSKFLDYAKRTNLGR